MNSATFPDAPPISVTIVNDYEVVVRGLAAMLQPFSDRVRVVETDVGGLPRRTTDVALFDTFASRSNTLDRAAEMLEEGRADHVVLYTWDVPQHYVDRARAIGVSGIIAKSDPAAVVVDSLEAVVGGGTIGFDAITKTPNRGRALQQRDRTGPETGLSEREREVLALLATGMKNSEIAGELFLAVDTVKTYVRRLYEKLGVKNRTQAALCAQAHELACSLPLPR